MYVTSGSDDATYTFEVVDTGLQEADLPLLTIGYPAPGETGIPLAPTFTFSLPGGLDSADAGVFGPGVSEFASIGLTDTSWSPTSALPADAALTFYLSGWTAATPSLSASSLAFLSGTTDILANAGVSGNVGFEGIRASAQNSFTTELPEPGAAAALAGLATLATVALRRRRG